MPGDLQLISPTRPWLPPAATGQLAAVSSFSHLVTLRGDTDPHHSLPTTSSPLGAAASELAARFTSPSAGRASGGGGKGKIYTYIKEPSPRFGAQRMNFAPFAESKAAAGLGSAIGAGAGSRENEPERPGKMIRLGEVGRATTLPGYSQRIPPLA